VASRDMVVVAMSGGVDSSVAAALLVEQGYQVTGLMLRLWSEGDQRGNRCCTTDAVVAARQVAGQLGVPFYVRDYGETFRREVVDEFAREYAAGRTPNPCIVCNERVRFGALLQEALALGADYLATGHYARVQRTAAGEYQLLRGVDRSKDQSYVLYRLNQNQLSHVLFPLGDYVKSNVRGAARRLGLPVCDRPDSQDLCFVGDGDYHAFVMRYVPESGRPGPLLDTAGNLLGEHRGLAHYTVGQRKGLGLSWARPMYVVRLDATQNAVVVGSADELGRDELIACRVNYISGHPPSSPATITARIRYKANDTPAVLSCLPDNRVHLKLDQPVRAVAPGQSAVFYQGHRLLGGGFIE
jgi:tRNA-specific 2-thiouridylase